MTETQPPSEERLPEPGSRLAHYRIEHVLGSGAMGVVFRAHDTGLERAVAVKVLREGISKDAHTVERFAQEARAAARVSHQNLAHIYYVGAQDGFRFFAMELVPGEDLEEAVAQSGPLDLDEALDYLLQTARGMAAAHRAGVVHRDLKPSNLIRRPDGTVKITDFGLSKSLDAEVGTTQAGQVLGTPTFMSPEQCRGDPVDPRTDIYALGLTAYFLLTGQPPFPGPSMGRVISDQINAPLPRLTKVRPSVPESVEDVLDRMCAKDPNDRPPDMDAVIDLLEAVRPREIEPAPIAARGAALAIDLIAASLVSMALLTPYFMLAGDSLVVPTWGLGAAWIGIILVPELLRQRTPGKWMLDLKIAREDGMRPNRSTLFFRYLYRYPATFVWVLSLIGLPVLVERVSDVLQIGLMLTGALAYFMTGGRTLSDILTSTRVVYSRPDAKERMDRFQARREKRRARREARRKKRAAIDPNSQTKLKVERDEGSTHH